MRCVCVFIPPTSTEHIQYLCKVLEVGSSTGDQSVVVSVLQLDVRGMQVLGQPAWRRFLHGKGPVLHQEKESGDHAHGYP